MFNKAHVKLCTAQVVYHAMTGILDALREGHEPMLETHCESDIAGVVREAWLEQKMIGWDQILKDRISTK